MPGAGEAIPKVELLSISSRSGYYEAMIIGHARVVNYLKAVIEKRTWAHGYLFCGPQNVGKETAALVFAKSLLCDAKTLAFGGCGRCETCVLEDPRAANRIYRLQLEVAAAGEWDKAEAKNITIKQVHALRHWLTLASEKNRAVIVNPAEKLGGDASNALLKMLEEPSQSTVFILISASPEYVFPTIRSRLVTLRFGTMAKKEMQTIRGATDKLIALARGRPGSLFSMLADKIALKAEEELFTIGERVYHGSTADALTAAKKFADDEHGRKVIFEYLLNFLRKDILVLEGEALKEATACVKTGLSAYTMLETVNVNPRLSADIMFNKLQKPRSLLINQTVSIV